MGNTEKYANIVLALRKAIKNAETVGEDMIVKISVPAAEQLIESFLTAISEALSPDEREDLRIVRECRDGKIKKFSGRGVVIINQSFAIKNGDIKRA